MSHLASYILTLSLGVSVSAAVASSDIVARVNDTPITRQKVRDVVESTLSLERERRTETDVRRLEAAALESLIDLELLYQASVARGVNVSDADLDEEIARSKSRFPDDVSFADALALKRMTPEDLREDTRKMMAVNRYLEQSVWRDIEITPEEVARFYHDNRDGFRRPAQVRVSHILLRLPADATDAQRRAVRTKALEIRSRLRDGDDFEALARQFSEDKATVSEGGDLGFFARGTLVDSFEEPVFLLMPGQISDILETQYGFHIAKVTDRQLAAMRSLDEVRDTIREILTERERQRRQAYHVAQLRRQATIEIYDPSLATPQSAERGREPR
jgi:peptidyl-prolyl cis-trans isomerase C